MEGDESTGASENAKGSPDGQGGRSKQADDVLPTQAQSVASAGDHGDALPGTEPLGAKAQTQESSLADTVQSGEDAIGSAHVDTTAQDAQGSDADEHDVAAAVASASDADGGAQGDGKRRYVKLKPEEIEGICRNMARLMLEEPGISKMNAFNRAQQEMVDAGLMNAHDRREPTSWRALAPRFDVPLQAALRGIASSGAPAATAVKPHTVASQAKRAKPAAQPAVVALASASPAKPVAVEDSVLDQHPDLSVAAEVLRPASGSGSGAANVMASMMTLLTHPQVIERLAQAFKPHIERLVSQALDAREANRGGGSDQGQLGGSEGKEILLVFQGPQGSKYAQELLGHFRCRIWRMGEDPRKAAKTAMAVVLPEDVDDEVFSEMKDCCRIVVRHSGSVSRLIEMLHAAGCKPAEHSGLGR